MTYAKILCVAQLMYIFGNATLSIYLVIQNTESFAWGSEQCPPVDPGYKECCHFWLRSVGIKSVQGACCQTAAFSGNHVACWWGIAVSNNDVWEETQVLWGKVLISSLWTGYMTSSTKPSRWVCPHYMDESYRRVLRSKNTCFQYKHPVCMRGHSIIRC